MFFLINRNICMKNFRKKYSHDIEKCNNQDAKLTADKQTCRLTNYELLR